MNEDNRLTTWPLSEIGRASDLAIYKIWKFQALFEWILINSKDGAPLQEQSLNLSVKGKLMEIDVQNYKDWLLDHAQEDCFESLVD